MSDAAKWDRKYRRKEHRNELTPDPLLVEYSDRFEPAHTVIDLACGTGRNAVFVAKLGCFTVALDCSREALRRCKTLAQESDVQIHAIAADLNETRLATESTDAIVCFNYLNLELAENMQAALRPGGLLIMKTFNQNFLNINPRFNSDYVLKPGSLKTAFNQLRIVAADDDCVPQSKTKSFIVAQKPDRSSPPRT
ncbi:MAG: class I SAM-dependent methyltransferase [Acidiferrobacterales bacterium]|nr:class I SAM-dependent methyltransferase [Acidiferrobacterales bacterium]